MQIIFQLFPKYKPLQINTAKITEGEEHTTRASQTFDYVQPSRIYSEATLSQWNL